MKQSTLTKEDIMKALDETIKIEMEAYYKKDMAKIYENMKNDFVDYYLYHDRKPQCRKYKSQLVDPLKDRYTRERMERRYGKGILKSYTKQSQKLFDYFIHKIEIRHQVYCMKYNWR